MVLDHTTWTIRAERTAIRILMIRRRVMTEARIRWAVLYVPATSERPGPWIRPEKPPSHHSDNWRSGIMRLVVCTCQNTSVTLKGSYDIDLPLAVTPGKVCTVHPYLFLVPWLSDKWRQYLEYSGGTILVGRVAREADSVGGKPKGGSNYGSSGRTIF